MNLDIDKFLAEEKKASEAKQNKIRLSLKIASFVLILIIIPVYAYLFYYLWDNRGISFTRSSILALFFFVLYLFVAKLTNKYLEYKGIARCSLTAIILDFLLIAIFNFIWIMLVLNFNFFAL